ncbi:MAG: hypothetical protein OEY23_26350, partial [Acidimicrobiia bacterium]|nr:hypothetical protein [Acidimicrobiia bacterium]
QPGQPTTVAVVSTSITTSASASVTADPEPLQAQHPICQLASSVAHVRGPLVVAAFEQPQR